MQSLAFTLGEENDFAIIALLAFASINFHKPRFYDHRGQHHDITLSKSELLVITQEGRFFYLFKIMFWTLVALKKGGC